jgi:hypothetical protein
MRRVPAADPAAARRDGGPFQWEPLLYLAYARHDPRIPADATLETARLLLAAGADPDAGYLWHGLPSPFTALTGGSATRSRARPNWSAASSRGRSPTA